MENKGMETKQPQNVPMERRTGDTENNNRVEAGTVPMREYAGGEKKEEGRRVKVVIASSTYVPIMDAFSFFDALLEWGQDEAEGPEDFGEAVEWEAKTTPASHLQEYGPTSRERDGEREAGTEGNPADCAGEEERFGEERAKKKESGLVRLPSQLWQLQKKEEESVLPVGSAVPEIYRSEGMLYRRDDAVVIRYLEGEESGMGQTQSEITLPLDRADMAIISRSGEVVSSLVCEKGHRHISTYHTPIRPLEMCVFTLDCSRDLGEDGCGSVFLDYYIEIRGSEAQHTRVRITIKPA